MRDDVCGVVLFTVVYAFYAFYAWWIHFPQSGALAEGTSLPTSRQTQSDVERSLRGVPLNTKATIFMAF